MRSAEEHRSPVQFGRWLFRPQGRELLVDGQPVQLGSRALAILSILVEARGQLVTKDEILSRVWPGIVVEENTLQAQISALRKALGEDREYLKTISGRGYRFVPDVSAASGDAFRAGGSVASADAATRPPTNLPVANSDLIGREAELAHVVDLAASHRLVTLIGAGGIGKTRLGIAAAWHLLPRFPDGVWIAELASQSDPELVPVTVATALGLDLDAGTLSPEQVAAAVASRRLLLVLDNCEHVVEAAARMVEALLRAGPSTCVMTTSREPLRAEGEFICRIPPLEVPSEGTERIDDLLRAGAVGLFVARARAADRAFSPDQQAAVLIAAICRRLDGIPLAIELAAARAAVLGVNELASRLDDRFALLASGRRTALPRHQTLRATLDWSYELLPERERAILCRLAIFAGGFTLDAASKVAAREDAMAVDVVECVANLVSKSLVTADASRSAVGYRLLKTTRAYALEKLIESGEFESVARRHAEYCLALLEGAETARKLGPAAEWLAAYARWNDDVRAALDWAFSLGDDESLGVSLTVAAVPLWLQMSLSEECRERAERALVSVNREASGGERRAMQLYAALGASVIYAKGPDRGSCAAWTKALELAERLGDTEYQLRALYGLWAYRASGGEYRIALALAQRFSRLAASSEDLGDRLVGDRLIGVVLHYLGDQAAARPLVERILNAPASPSSVIRFQLDQRVTGLAHVARILWLQGFPDQAMHTARRAVELACASDHAVSLCYALAAAACPIALLEGDLEEAERCVAMLVQRSATLAFGAWNASARCYEGVLLARRGDIVPGPNTLRTALNELGESRLPVRYTSLLGELAEAMGRTGAVAQGLDTIEEALERCERNDERWCMAELVRVKGELVLAGGAPEASAAAERCFLEAIDWARRQGALSWELRCATSLARLRSTQDRTTEALQLLASVYARFTEGFGSADLVTAKAILDAPPAASEGWGSGQNR